MNVIDVARRELSRSLFLKGESIRSVVSLAGVARETAHRIRKIVIAEHGAIRCQCGKTAGHGGWCGHRTAKSPARIAYLMNTWGDLTSVNIYVPTRPRYERPEISYERETELYLLVNRGAYCLDAPNFDGGESGHSFISCHGLTPLDILMMKEESDSPDARMDARRADEYRRWLDRKNSAFQTT